MALTKRTYADNQTVITAENLNEIQDEIIRIGEAVDNGSGGGVSVTHEWEGTVLKVTSASGTSSADLKGEKGDDYVLTDADKQEIASMIPGSGGSVQVDSALSETSTNPVQNKVVTVAFNQAMQLLETGVIPKLLPDVTEEDNGKFLQNVSGAWSAVDVQPLMAELVSAVVNSMFVPISKEEYDALEASGNVDESKYYMIVEG